MPPMNVSSINQQELNFKKIKHTKLRIHKQNKKYIGKKGESAKFAKCDMHVKLNIPVSICKALPSVNSFNMKRSEKPADEKYSKSMGVYKRHKVSTAESDKSDIKTPMPLLGVKRRKGEITKYQLFLQKEKKFPGMIWDLALGNNGDIVIAGTEEVILCNKNLEQKKTLENVMAPGGCAFLSNDQIAVVCRSSDNVNVFSPEGIYKQSFMCGPSPCGLAVNSSDELIVTDTGAKLVRFYSPEGQLLRTIEKFGSNYELRWPLYVTVNPMDDVIVSDCHQQKVLVFDENGQFKSYFNLSTQCGSMVLRPHGLSVNKEGDLFVIDTAVHSMEVFSWHGSFRQTLLPSDDGVLIKPKVISISKDNNNLAVGGMNGTVRLYKFVSVKEPVSEQKSPSSHQKNETRKKLIVKKEIKEEVIVLD